MAGLLPRGEVSARILLRGGNGTRTRSSVFKEKGVFSWTNLLPSETLADVVNLKAPGKLRSAGTDLH